ncbi:hypothetical protein SDC9_169104 [bioreactor metagenome]|uniref:Uncharacterized protein n=1 Tax=bioreactor metagenome TaxID=1076179 RepID=A0A645GCJ5_9ZZZZ
MDESWKQAQKRKQERNRREERKEESLNQPLHILNRGGQEGLFAHVVSSEHAGIAQAVVLLGLCERSLNGFLASGVQSLSLRGLGKRRDIFQRILPYMPCHHPSGRLLTETCRPPRASRAIPPVAEVLPVTLPRRRLPVEMFTLGTEVSVEGWVVLEAVLCVVLSLVRMAAVADDALDSLLFQQMRDPRAVVPRVETHVLGQVSQPSLDLFQ